MTEAFHVVMSTVGRPVELRRYLRSLVRQDVSFHVTLVEQNDKAASLSLLESMLAPETFTYIHSPVERGLSRGRNLALRAGLRGQIVCFPDDDCVYPDGLLAEVRRMLAESQIDGVCARQLTPTGEPSMLRWREDRFMLSRRDVPRTVNSSTIFLSAELVGSTGEFDPALGVGAGTRFGAGEENDYVLRALDLEAKLAYEPAIHVVQDDWRSVLTRPEMLKKVRGYNRGFGHVLRKHSLHASAAYWIGRSLVGVGAAVFRSDIDGAVQVQQLSGRVEGWIARD